MRLDDFSGVRVGFFALCLLFSGCALNEKDETLTWSVQKLYGEAKANLNSGSLSTSRKYYGKLVARFPFGRYAQQSLLDLIQLEYKDREFDKAIAQADKFLQLYPKSPYADYARYMKGVISYSRDISIVDRLVPTNIAQSDQSLMKKAYEHFENLNVQSPNGEYTVDAKMRMLFLRNVTAEHEIYVAEYYLRRGAYLAAANRANYVIENYQTTPSSPLALAVMVRAYRELAMPKFSDDAQRVLAQNFPKYQENPRINHILTGNIHKKRSFFDKLGQNLTN